MRILTLFVLLTLFAPLQAQVCLTTGGMNSALEFDGIDDQILIPDNSLLDGFDDFTIEMWFKANAAGGWQHLAKKIAAGSGAFTDDAWNLGLLNNVPVVELASGGALTYVAGFSTVADGQWHHLALTRSGVTCQILVDGVVDLTFTHANTLNDSPVPVALGCSTNISGVAQEFSNVKLDEVRIWSVFRTPTQLDYWSTRSLSGNELGLVAYYPCDTGAGQLLLDQGLNGIIADLGTGPAPDAADPLWITDVAPVTCPPLGLEAIGNVGATAGGPFDVLSLNGYSGGYERAVRVAPNVTFNIDLATAPGYPAFSDFLLFGYLGVPMASSVYTTPYGDMVFPPGILFPQFFPLLMTVANTFNPPDGLVLAIAAPSQILVQGGLPFIGQITFQAVMVQSYSPVSLEVTNAVILDLGPLNAPTITALSATGGAVGTTIIVSGTDFGAGATLDIGGLPINPTSYSPTALEFSIPAAMPCDTGLTVVNPDGQMSAPWTFNPSPVITNAVFTSGPAAGGVLFVLAGTGMIAGTTVDIGGTPATVIAVSAGGLQLTTPPGNVGVATVTVTTPSGCTTTTTYTYL